MSSISFQKLSAVYPLHDNLPCFATTSVMLTQTMIRSHLKRVLQKIGFLQHQCTFHTFRRSGATLAHNLGVDIQAISRHGTWRSDAVNTYIVNDPQLADGVAGSFAAFLQ